MVDIPPTPKEGGLQREMVVRPSQLSFSSALPNYKAAGAWPRQGGALRSHQKHSHRPPNRCADTWPGQWTLTRAQSQREPSTPNKYEGQLQGLPTCAESSAFNLILGFLLWVPGEMSDIANQISEGSPCKEQTADFGPVQHLLCVTTAAVATICQQLLFVVLLGAKGLCLHCRIRLSRRHQYSSCPCQQPLSPPPCILALSK